MKAFIIKYDAFDIRECYKFIVKSSLELLYDYQTYSSKTYLRKDMPQFYNFIFEEGSKL